MIEHLTLSPCECQLRRLIVDLINLMLDAIRLSFQQLDRRIGFEDFGILIRIARTQIGDHLGNQILNINRFEQIGFVQLGQINARITG